ncbi:gibberellin 2-oxidase [Lentinula edodes]|uniref:gibberellin 2-oxidase n=1 Tax=Lentinula edodes TaxID=5353 RepID=UPI001E8E1152|nr:gibberellin 2-oxidase [Lentinula edodes]KAH7872665.1 gibberellin 2-oxidase [Lentinula edodes]
MPALVNSNPPPPLVSWSEHPVTTEPLDWAPLVIIDLAKFDQPGGKQELANELKDAVKLWGFWTVINTGISQEQLDRQLDIGNTFFKQPLAEKKKVACNFSEGNYFGYREPYRLVGKSDVKENMEMLNLPKYTPHYESYPRHDFIQAYKNEIQPFHRLVWDNVIRKLFILFAIILELPEDYFVQRHDYDKPSEDHLRYMIYHPRPAEDDAKIGGQWSAGHTDFGSMTLLFSQSVAALQIRTPNNEWKWVKHIPGGITCNAADTLSFLTKGYIKSTVHRVMRPPPDQANLERLGLFYFVRPGDDVPMVPAPSPVLIREGYLSEDEAKLASEGQISDAVKGFEYVRARVKNVHTRNTRHVHDGRGMKEVFRLKNLEVPDFYV